MPSAKPAGPSMRSSRFCGNARQEKDTAARADGIPVRLRSINKSRCLRIWRFCRRLFGCARDAARIAKMVFSRCRLRLRYLVVVMHGNVLDTAGVDVYLFAKRGADHRGAFDVPAGKSFAPRRIPTELRVRFPQHKVARVALLWICRDARTLLLPLEINAAKFAVIRKARGVVIYAVRLFDTRTPFRSKSAPLRSQPGYSEMRAGILFRQREH